MIILYAYIGAIGRKQAPATRMLFSLEWTQKEQSCLFFFSTAIYKNENSLFTTNLHNKDQIQLNELKN